MKLEEAARGIYVISPSLSAGRVGVIADDLSHNAPSIYLIDSGGCADDARTILRAVKAELGQVKVKAVILTHSHSDHCGGAAELVRQTGCEVWITAGERGGLENNRIQATVTCGSYPVPEIDVPYYVAEKCAASRVISAEKMPDKNTPEGGGRGESGEHRISAVCKMIFVPLPGHCFDMTGVAVNSQDGKRVFFAADALFGAQMVGRFPIPFMMDIGAFLQTLDMIEHYPADIFVPSHGDILTESAQTVEMNRLAILTTIAAIEKVLRKPLTTDEVLKEVFDAEGMVLKKEQYFLVGSTIRSFLAYLYREKRITCRIEENKLLWLSGERGESGGHYTPAASKAGTASKMVAEH